MDLVDPGRVPAGWTMRSIEDACARVSSGDTPSRKEPEFYEQGIWPWVKTQELRDGWIDDTDEHITDAAVHRSSAKILPPDTVLMAMYGATVGRLGMLRREMTCNQACIALIADTASTDARFLYYSLLASRESIRSLAVGAAQQNLSGVAVRKMRLPFPVLKEQHRIASILGTLDDKIELNRRMNEILEEMARALFKSWFVDFDPVRAKAAGRDPGLPKHLADLFPDRLVDSELGEIPEGWDCAALGEVVREHRDGVNPLDNPESFFDHFSIPAFDAGRMPARELGVAIRSQKYAVPQGAVLLSKLNPETGRVWAPGLDAGVRSVCSTEFVVLTPEAPVGRAWLQSLLTSTGIRETLSGLVTGTSKSHQRVQKASLFAVKFALPEQELLAKYEELVAPWLSRAINSREEGTLLGGTRDALLQKLLQSESEE